MMATTRFFMMSFILLGHARASLHSCPAGTSVFELVKERKYNLTGTTHVITGDVGIALGIIKGLAFAGAHVVVLAHNIERANKVLESVSGDISLRGVDLASFASTKKVASEILEQEYRIDTLTLDAGDPETWETGSFLTADGFEANFEVSFVSQVLLTEILLPKLRETQGRVIATSYINPAGATPPGTLDGMCAFQIPLAGLKPISALCGTQCWTPAGLEKMSHTLMSSPNQNSVIMYYLRDLHMNYLSRKEASHGIFAGTFSPGAVDSPAMRDMYKNMGISPAVVGQLCRDPNGMGASWESCLCAGPDGSKSAECPLQATDMPSAFYLLAAPKEELVGLSGHLSMLCGELASPKYDTMPILELTLGSKKSAFDYIDTVMAMTKSWIAEGDMGEKFSTKEGPELEHFGLILAVLFFTGLVFALARMRRSKDSEQTLYAPLSPDADSC